MDEPKQRSTRTRHAIEVLPDTASLAPRAAEWFIGQIAHAVAKRGRAVVALSGGSTPKALFECLSQPPWVDRVPWDRVHVFWGDERFVPPADPQRNARMAQDALLDRVGIPEAHLYPMPFDDPAGSDDRDATLARASEAAALYETTLHGFYGGATLAPDRPFFDVMLLGIGEDGHTASLFPDEPSLDERTHWVVAVATDAKPPPVRITMTYPLIESSHAVLFLVAGDEKRDSARRALDGDTALPAARVHPVGGTLWMMDEAAAGGAGDRALKSAGHS